MIAILEAKRASLLSREHWMNNILAGVIVGVFALPLAMAFAIASGVKPEQGIYTAIVAGGLTSLFGGKVPFIDATGMQTLGDLLVKCKRHKTHLVLCGTQPNILKKLKLAGLLYQLGKENVLVHIHHIMNAKKCYPS